MIFVPINKHIEIEPLEEKAVISSQNVTFEEKGKVISSADDCEEIWDEGVVVYFDAWLVAKYVGSDGKERFLVPESAVRGYEEPDDE